MDILGMLQNDFDELCEEDLKMIEQELDLGDYSYVYKEQCKIFINKARHYFVEKKDEKGYLGNLGITGDFVMTENEVKVLEDPNKQALVPEEDKSENKTQSELFREKLEEMRPLPSFDKRFITYINSNDYVTNSFIDQNFKVFTDVELAILLRNRQFDEAFLGNSWINNWNSFYALWSDFYCIRNS